MIKKITALITIFAILAITSACSLNGISSVHEKNVTVKLMIGRDKQWIFDEIQHRLNQNKTTVNGKTIKIVTDKAGTGEAMDKILQPQSEYIG